MKEAVNCTSVEESNLSVLAENYLCWSNTIYGNVSDINADRKLETLKNVLLSPITMRPIYTMI
jgi:hypothetical protein